ncbi:MAG: hypothetical protein ACK55I_34935, partial [bacterium]
LNAWIDVVIQPEGQHKAAQRRVDPRREASAQLAFRAGPVVIIAKALRQRQHLAALGAHIAVVLPHILLQHQAHLAPAVAGAVMQLVQQAMVQALLAHRLVLGRRRALEGTSRRQQVV